MKKTSLSFELSCGTCLRADAWGNPSDKPVLLSHGGGQTRHSWGGTAESLARRGWYAVAYDHRGHGQSGWSEDGNYELERFAQDQAALAREFSQPPVLVGASLGGLSAMLAQGECDEELFAAIVLVDITPRMNLAGALNIINFMRADMEHGFTSLEEAASAIAEYTGRPPRTDLSGLQKNLRKDKDGRYRWHWDPAFVAQQNRNVGASGRLEQAARQLRQPVLLVRGRLSDLVTEELAQEFLQMVPHARYADVENARHMVAGDRNDLFTNAVVEFLNTL